MKQAGGSFSNLLNSKNTTVSLLVVLGLSIVAAVVLAFFTNRADEDANQRAKYSDDLRVLSQEIAKNSGEAAKGKEEAFRQLKKATGEFTVNWYRIENGDNDMVTTYKHTSADKTDFDEILRSWKLVEANANMIMQAKDTILELQGKANEVQDAVVNIQNSYSAIADELVRSGASSAAVSKAQEQRFVAERILSNVRTILDGGEQAKLAVEQLEVVVSNFATALSAFDTGNTKIGIAKIDNAKAKRDLTNIAKEFLEVSKITNSIIAKSTDLIQVSNAANDIFTESRILLKEASDLSVKIALGESKSPWLNLYLILAFVALAIACIFLLALTILPLPVTAYVKPKKRMIKTKTRFYVYSMS